MIFHNKRPSENIFRRPFYAFINNSVRRCRRNGVCGSSLGIAALS
ncbi:hypothetical protein NEISUBOT_04962 [Neisseria subflava NJ9703]|uniref:Uncharacterized protein n=1 Tax=Neisseria subflava NJ9703 TaxID=546268 RepID=A0A9W5IPY6_NEISU|nr:hypothetical protein NEISUBOT_04962 [Neisseria subflava NJ9703]